MIKIEFDIKNNRSVAYDDDVIIGMCEFINTGDTWKIVHTEVNKSHQGQGIAKRLVEMVMKEAENNNKKIIAECSYALKKIKE